MKLTYKLNEASLTHSRQHVVEKRSKSWGMTTVSKDQFIVTLAIE